MSPIVTYAFIWFGLDILSIIVAFALIATHFAKGYHDRANFVEYINSEEIDAKIEESLGRYLLKPTVPNRILENLCWPVTFIMVLLWTYKEFVPIVKACPEPEVQTTDVTTTWILDADDKGGEE